MKSTKKLWSKNKTKRRAGGSRCAELVAKDMSVRRAVEKSNLSYRISKCDAYLAAKAASSLEDHRSDAKVRARKRTAGYDVALSGLTLTR